MYNLNNRRENHLCLLIISYNQTDTQPTFPIFFSHKAKKKKIATCTPQKLIGRTSYHVKDFFPYRNYYTT